MIGIDNLIKMRMQGKRPDHVWINFNHQYRPIKHDFEWQGMELEYRHTKDLRPFIGLDVMIHSKKWSASVSELYEELQKYAKWIGVFIDDFGDDLGWQWDRTKGRYDFE